MATYSFISQGQLDSIRAKVCVACTDQRRERAPYKELRTDGLMDASEQVTTDPIDRGTADRQLLKELSEDRAKHWPNTLQAQRDRKERVRQERLAAEESERVECDKREAELRAEQRRVQIERANKILFDETDRVKAFHGKLLESDVIQENQALIGYRQQIEVLKRAQDQAFVEQQRQALEAAELAELAKMLAIKNRAMEQQQVQRSQLEDLKTHILMERATSKREGQLLKARAIEEEEELRKKEQDRVATSKQYNAETRAANEVLQTFRNKEVERGREQERAIEAYAKKKQEMLDGRARREEERKALKDAHRQRIADHVEKSHRDRYSKIEAMVERDCAEADKKAAEDEAARKQRILDTIASIDASRKAQLANKAEIKAAEREEDMHYSAAWTQRTKELKQEEEAEVQERGQRNRQVRDFQLHQAEIKARKMAKVRIAELQEAAMIQLSLQEQDDIFQQYTALCIEEYRNQGKTTVPMELFLKKKMTVETMR